MKIIVPTHNHEEIKIPIDKNLIYKIDTDDLNNEFDGIFYGEIAKLFYIWKHQLIKDDIIGLFQCRRYLGIDLLNLKINDDNEVYVTEHILIIQICI